MDDILGWCNPYEGELSVFDAFDLSGWTWVDDAACADMDPEAFFHNDNPAMRQLLGRVCERCPVKTPCLQRALDYDERGWWGGTTREDRKRLLKARADAA